MKKIIAFLVTTIFALWLGVYVGIYTSICGIIEAINLYPPISGGLIAWSIVKFVIFPTISVWIWVITSHIIVDW